MGRTGSLMGLLKPELPLSAGICVVVGEALALGHLPELWMALWGFLIGFLISGSEMVSNDYFDLEVDRVNHPDRPLPSGQVSVREVLYFTALLSISGLLVSALLGPLTLAFTAALWAMGMLYNWRLKSLGLPGNVIVATSVGMTFVLGGIIVGHPDDGLVWTFALMAFLFDLAEEVSGGVMDAEGDALRGSKSLAISFGRRVAMSCVTALFAAFIIVGTIPFLLGWLGLPYMLLMLASYVAIAVMVSKLWRVRTPEEGRNVQRMLYLVMISFIIAIFVVVVV